MSTIQFALPSKIYDIIERKGINTTKQILLLSIWDIKKITNLSHDDIILLKNIVSEYVTPKCLTRDKLIEQNCQTTRISMGCEAADKLLKGGFRRGTLTELYGESGSGKTQICIQTSANIWPEGSVYICTEDLFPVKRYNQMIKRLPNYNSDIEYGKNIYIEHVTEAHELLSCVRVRLPKLLEQHKVSLIVIDSIAAPFRTDYTNYVQRAEDLREVAMSLISIAQKFDTVILCVNQVTSSLEENVDIPSLGLAWSNMVSTRLCLRKTMQTVKVLETISSEEKSADSSENVCVRQLIVKFAPDLPKSSVNIIITPSGIHDVNVIKL